MLILKFITNMCVVKCLTSSKFSSFTLMLQFLNLGTTGIPEFWTLFWKIGDFFVLKHPVSLKIFAISLAF